MSGIANKRKSIKIHEHLLLIVKKKEESLFILFYLFIYSFIFLRHINLLGQLLPNQVKKRGGTERSVMLEFISREMVFRKNLVLLKVYL